MATSLNIRGAGSVEVKVPKVWFFPKTRMISALRKAGYVLEDTKSNVGRTSLVSVYKNDINVGNYYPGKYYPDFVTYDETLKQTVAPYAVIVEKPKSKLRVIDGGHRGGGGGGGGGGGA